LKNHNEIKEKDELTWKEIFTNFFLIRTIIPLVLTIIVLVAFGNTSSKESDLIVGLGVVLVIGTIFGFLTFLKVAVVKLLKTKNSEED
jgi:NhaP-type Na+/H+ or K+/H+ antiporter